MKKLLKDYSLSISLFLLFSTTWAGQIAAQLLEGEGITKVIAATLENWQSEFLQLFTFVILTTYLIHRGSPQSRDGDDEVMKRIKVIQSKQNEIEEKLDTLLAHASREAARKGL